MSDIVWEREPGTGQIRPHFVSAETGEKIPTPWAPLPGSQQAFLSSPYYETLLEGNRGGGKTVTLLMDYLQYVGRGYGSEYKGLLLRRTLGGFKELEEKSFDLFTQIYPGSEYNRNKHQWTFPGGEILWFGHLDAEEDAQLYRGVNFYWIGFDELTLWPSPEAYLKMFTLLRGTNKSIRRRVRATTNPGNVGHSWVKARFNLPAPPDRVLGDPIDNSTGTVRQLGEGDPGDQRISIRSSLLENFLLLDANPKYLEELKAAATSEAELRANVFGDWDIVAGGMFDDLWKPKWHVLPRITADMIPRSWPINRAYDHGQAKPASCGWYTESTGEPLILPDGRKVGVVRGDIVRFAEEYFCGKKPDEGLRLSSTDIAIRIKGREAELGLTGRVRPGPADTSIYTDAEPGKSPAALMASIGVKWTRADKRPGSRKLGWQQIRQMLKDAVPAEDGFRERPGLFVTEDCRHFLRLFPVAPRDPRDPDDVDTDSEDHILDELRYRVRRDIPKFKIKRGAVQGQRR